MEELKERLKRIEIFKFSKHAIEMIRLREGNKDELIGIIKKQENLVYYYKEEEREVYCLFFKISNKRTIKLPVIFKGNGKTLYILTYIMRYRPWQNMIRKERRW